MSFSLDDVNLSGGEGSGSKRSRNIVDLVNDEVYILDIQKTMSGQSHILLVTKNTTVAEFYDMVQETVGLAEEVRTVLLSPYKKS